MKKAAVREEMRMRRRNLGEGARQRMEEAAMLQLLSLPELQQKEWLYAFVSGGTEIDTQRVLDFLLAEGRHRVAVPRVTGEEMEFIEISSLDGLHPGAMHILEPREGDAVKAQDGVMLLPGLAFDRLGNRLGYGAAYYDHYLAEYETEQLYKVGYAFGFQVIESLEAEEHDRKVDCIVTDQGTLHFGRHVVY